MLREINEILSGLPRDENGVWCSLFENISQKDEIQIREKVATKVYDNYMDEIANHHSVEVMDYEVRRALKMVPENGIVIDVGGCFGWHWRSIYKQRPDVQVVIVDFVKQNLIHAQNILGPVINKSIHLVHGDATKLPFPDSSFDLYWSVQALQHIPEFGKTIEEARRILRGGGVFLNYSLNHEKAIELLYKLLGKDYITKGRWGNLYLARASNQQASLIEKIFDKPVKRRFTEVFFHPDLRFKNGKEGNLLGKIDALIGSSFLMLGWFARQQIFQIVK